MVLDSRRELDNLAADLAAIQRRIANAQYLQRTERASDLQAWVNFVAMAEFSGEASRRLPKLPRRLDGTRTDPRSTQPWPLRTPPGGISVISTSGLGIPRPRDPRSTN